MKTAPPRTGAPFGQPPAVDEGGAPGSLKALRPYLEPFPGRLANTMRVTGITLLVIIIGEVFRLPETSLIAYLPVIFFKGDADMTTLLGPAYFITVALSIVVSVVIFIFALSQPALRLPAMSLAVFALAFLSHASSGGPLVLLAGFLVMYSQKAGDDLLSGALSGSVYSNNTSLSLPEIAFLPPEEAMIHNLLYIVLVVALPSLVIVVVNGLTMRDPATKLRDALADRLGAAAAFCEGGDGARARLAAFAKEGTAQLVKQNGLAGKLAKRRHDPRVGVALIEGLTRLILALLAWDYLDERETSSRAEPARLAAPCRRLERAVRDGKAPDGPAPEDPAPEGPAPEDLAPKDAASAPLVAELHEAVRGLDLAARGDDGPWSDARSARKGGFLKPDAFSNPVHVQFALKVTLAASIAYAFTSLADWSKVNTAITTCFLIALDSVGQSARKAALRLSGALVGGSIGIATILLIMPMLTDIGSFLLVLTPVLLAGAWITVGSERIAYFGQQMVFAFFLTMIQDYGPTLDFQTARDRMVGVVLGEVILFTIFAALWPVTVADVVRENLADAFHQLAAMLAAPDAGNSETDERRGAARKGFGAAIAGARTALPDEALEPSELRNRSPRGNAARRPIDGDVITRVQALIVPVTALVRANADAPAEEATRGAAGTASQWFDDYAAWVRTGEDAPGLLGPPSDRSETGDDGAGVGAGSARPDARAEWGRILHEQVAHLVDAIGPAARPIVEAGPRRGARLDPRVDPAT